MLSLGPISLMTESNMARTSDMLPALQPRSTSDSAVSYSPPGRVAQRGRAGAVDTHLRLADRPCSGHCGRFRPFGCGAARAPGTSDGTGVAEPSPCEEPRENPHGGRDPTTSDQ